MSATSDVVNRQLFDKAHAAGLAAAEAHVPTPMVVERHANPFDDGSPVVQRYTPVMQGVCGFAWVTVRPGNSSFAKWLKASKQARNGYYGGVQLWVSSFGQSYEKKTAYAAAFAGVLTENGIKAQAEGRLD